MPYVNIITHADNLAFHAVDELILAGGLWHKLPRKRRQHVRRARGENDSTFTANGRILPVSTQNDSLANVASLLTRVASGERVAFETLYRATSGMLFAICLRVLPDRGEAEEALQDTYIAIWNKAVQFDPARAGPNTWLGAIARNRAIDRLRSNPAWGSSAPIDFAESIPDQSPSPLDLAQAGTDSARLDDCIRQLDARRRTLIHTAFFDAATYEELARRAQAPLGSVKSWIRRGLMQLRACLES